MNFKKILSGFVIALLAAAPVFAQQQLKIKRSGNIVRVTRGKKNLYNIALKGKANQKGRKYDVPLLPLWYPANVIVANKRIKNLENIKNTADWSFLKRLETAE